MVRKLSQKDTVLIVDDNPANSDILVDYLDHAGFNIVVAESGESALNQIEQIQPDIILLDILMPGIDGFETCRRLKSQPETKDIPVIFMTALEDTADKVKGFEVGAVDYVTKPLHNKEVLARLTTHLTIRNLQKSLQAQNVQLYREIAERQGAEESLRREKEQFRLMFELAPIGMAILTPGGRFQQVNQAFCDTLAYPANELLGQSFAGITHPDDLQVSLTMRQKLLQGDLPHFQTEKRYIGKNGQLIHAILQTTTVRDSEGRALHTIAQMVDITARKRAEEQLLYDALHDALTGLPNRALFLEHLEKALGHAERQKDYMFAVLSLDLDRFKVINDSLGHTVGDQLLVTIADRLVGSVRPGDTVARLGGDEFAVLLDGIKSMGDARRMANQIQYRLAMPINLAERQVSITASMGITLNTREYNQPEDFIRDADTATYRAKARGGAKHEMFETKMYNQAVKRLHLETELRQAINRREFEVHYQPVVSLTGGQITRIEALMRWPHPQQGFISPAQFIPLAEETGLIIPLDHWLWQTTCTQMMRWHAAGCTPLRLSVNVSVRQFQDKNLPELIKDVLQQTGLPASALELEITESIAMLSDEFSTTALHELNEMGVGLSIDDFGTGYSSLNRLKTLPVNTLKVDRSFVKDITSNADDRAIVTAIIAMARSLKLKVIAEGVETEAQLAFLQTQQCDEVQGYFFSPPLPAEAMTSLLQKERPWKIP